MYFSYNASSMWFPDLLLYFKLVSNAPYGGKAPFVVIFDLFAKSFDMNIDGSRVDDVFVTPDAVKKLFSCKYLVWM